MRNRLRLGAAAAVGLGVLLLATVLASPALAWHSNVDVHAKCLDSGKVGVKYTVTAWEEGHEATVYVFYKLDSGEGGKLPTGHFGEGEGESSFSGWFELPEGTTGTVTVVAVANWNDDQKPSKNWGEAELPDKCKGKETTTTTTPPSSSVSPTTSLETTTSAAVGAATTTTSGGGQLPFTGNSSGPMLLAGIVLVGGGSLFLLLSRARDGHATK
jgi:hypothetical protein